MSVPAQLEQSIRSIIPNLGGWTTPERGIEMAEIILESKPQLCVELGVFSGRSLIAQALALATVGSGHIIGIDSWRVQDAIEGENEANQQWWSASVNLEDIYRECMKAIWDNRLEPFVSVLRNASQHAASAFKAIDLLNIDGNHSEVASCRDVQLWVPKVIPNGYIWVDDADWPSTQKALGLMNEFCTLKRDFGHYRLYQRK